MTSGTDESWSSVRYILNKIHKECTVTRIHQHAAFQNELQEVFEARPRFIQANNGAVSDDVRQLFEQHCTHNGSPHVLLLHPETHRMMSLAEEQRIQDLQENQQSILKNLVSDDGNNYSDPNLYIVLDLDHTLINTYEYNAQTFDYCTTFVTKLADTFQDFRNTLIKDLAKDGPFLESRDLGDISSTTKGPQRRFRSTAVPLDFYDPAVYDHLIELCPHILSYPRSRASGVDGGSDGSADALNEADKRFSQMNSSETAEAVEVGRRSSSSSSPQSDGKTPSTNALLDVESKSADVADREQAKSNSSPVTTLYHRSDVFPLPPSIRNLTFKSRFIFFRPGTFRFLRTLYDLSQQLSATHHHIKKALSGSFEGAHANFGDIPPAFSGSIKLVVYTLSSKHYAEAIVEMLEKRLGVPPNSLFGGRIIARETNRQPERSMTHQFNVPKIAKYYWEKAQEVAEDTKLYHRSIQHQPQQQQQQQLGESNSNAANTSLTPSSATTVNGMAIPYFYHDKEGIHLEMKPGVDYASMSEEQGIEAFTPAAKKFCSFVCDYVIQKRSSREMLKRCKRLVDFLVPVIKDEVLVDVMIPESAIQFRLDVFLRDFIHTCKDHNFRRLLLLFYYRVLSPFVSRNPDALSYYLLQGRASKGSNVVSHINLASYATQHLQSQEANDIVASLAKSMQDNLNTFLASTHDLLSKKYRILESVISAEDNSFRFAMNTLQKGLRANGIPPSRAICIDDNRDSIWNTVEARNNLYEIRPFTPFPFTPFQDFQIKHLAKKAAENYLSYFNWNVPRNWVSKFLEFLDPMLLSNDEMESDEIVEKSQDISEDSSEEVGKSQLQGPLAKTCVLRRTSSVGDTFQYLPLSTNLNRHKLSAITHILNQDWFLGYDVAQQLGDNVPICSTDFDPILKLISNICYNFEVYRIQSCPTCVESLRQESRNVTLSASSSFTKRALIFPKIQETLLREENLFIEPPTANESSLIAEFQSLKVNVDRIRTTFQEKSTLSTENTGRSHNHNVLSFADGMTQQHLKMDVRKFYVWFRHRCVRYETFPFVTKPSEATVACIQSLVAPKDREKLQISLLQHAHHQPT